MLLNPGRNLGRRIERVFQIILQIPAQIFLTLGIHPPREPGRRGLAASPTPQGDINPPPIRPSALCKQQSLHAVQLLTRGPADGSSARLAVNAKRRRRPRAARACPAFVRTSEAVPGMKPAWW